MSSIADLSRPSSYLLLAVIAANLVLPVAHFYSSSRSVADAALEAQARAGRSDAVHRLAHPIERDVPVPVRTEIAQVSLRQPAPVCRAWGPFTDLAEAEALARQLELPSEDFEVFQAEVQSDPDYLVTVRAPGTREAAERVLRELQSQDIDSYILERGPTSNVLAVGVFSVASGADVQQRRLAELGYQADIEPLERSHRIFHLLARMPADLTPDIAPIGACGDIAPMQQFL